MVPGVERGFREMCEKGLLSGHKIAGVHFVLQDGAHHVVDSSEYSFFLAAQGAMKDAFEMGQWRLLEPIMMVEVTAPDEFMGTVMQQLTKRNGIITQTERADDWCTLYAEVPLNNMFGYASDLRYV